MRLTRALFVALGLLAFACSPDGLEQPLVSGPPTTAELVTTTTSSTTTTPPPPPPTTTTTTTAPPTTTTAPPPPTTQPVVAAAASEPVEPHQHPEPAPAASTGAHSGSLHPAIAAHFGTGELGHQAQRVAECESGLDAGAMSPTNDHGLFQINRPTWDKPEAWDGWQQTTGTPWSMVYDADTNARFARALYDRSGWGPWTCRHAA